MNILLYMPDMTTTWGGVRQYAAGIIKILAADTSHTYYVYHDGGDALIMDSAKAAGFTVISSAETRPPLISWSNKARRVLNFLSRQTPVKKQLRFITPLDILCRKYGIDIVHCPYQFTANVAGAKAITTLHDVQELHFPEFFSPEDRAYRASAYLSYLKYADKIIVSYKHVKEDLIKYFQVAPDKIHIVLLDMGKLWFESFLEEQRKNSLQPPEDIPGEESYLFYPANTWRHKNHLGLLQALLLLREEGLTIPLRLSGNISNEYGETVLKPFIKKHGLERQVTFEGVVDEARLFELYRNATGIVIPTLYEAGSFPLMESIQMGIPVICATTTSLPETIDNPDFTFDPNNITAMAEKMRLLWTSPEYRLRSKNNSLRLAPGLAKQKALPQFLKIYQSRY